jgi:hypothetical protein
MSIANARPPFVSSQEEEMLVSRLALVAASALVVGAANLASAAVFVDDFSSGDLSGYAPTVILDNNGGAANTASWQSVGGILQYNTSAYDGIEQSVLVRNGASLAVGEELQVDLSNRTASQDLGLYVGGVAPVAGVRQEYVNIYARNNGQIFSRGFDGTTELSLSGGGSPAYTSLFVARVAAGDYELGYYDGAIRNILTTRTGLANNDADVIGLYTDVRATGVLGDADNLRVVVIPEPASLSALGLGMIALRRRRHA